MKKISLTFCLALLFSLFCPAQVSPLQFNKNGEFKIVQFTDIHFKYGNPASDIALKRIGEVLDAERPDLVVFTGDVVYAAPADTAMRKVLSYATDRKIPFVVTFGNHDNEQGKTRAELYDVIRSMPFNIQPDRGGVESPDYVLTLKSSDGKKDAALLYCLDSHSYSKLPDVKGYDWLTFDQVNWYRQQSAAYAKKYGVDYNISFSEQKPSTDTIAADMENKPFRDNGKLLFRPGGHGALIENLNDLDADIIFIKNIDNVVPDKLKGDTVLYKKLIAGVLVALQQRAFAYLQLLDSGKYTHEQILEVLQFLQKQLYCKNPETKNLEDAELVIYLKEKLNRPMRVCGMVKNVGEPGGGPFLAYNSDGTISLQIMESSQIDMDDPEKKEMFEKGTHFNPVDLVCAVRDYKGHKFNLVKYVDKATGFISYKSKNGKDLKALELPGLWNGAMSDWNTVFVEVPLTTFNPVKTVNDLLRDQHQ